MQKLLWSLCLFVSLVLAQTENRSSPKGTQTLDQSLILREDSTSRIIINSPDYYTTDALQESLYVRIIEEMENSDQHFSPPPPQNNDQLLNMYLEYYPKATLRGDNLIIPYPPRKVETFKEIRYIIPNNYFTNANKPLPLQPDIRLKFNQGKSTLTINESYSLSFYRSPNLKNISLQQSKNALQNVFNLIIPVEKKYIQPVEQNIKTFIDYRGYKKHQIRLESDKQLSAFLECLCRQGSLYFFPSKIDDLEERIIIYGLLYVIKDDILGLYHFGELTVDFSKTYHNRITNIQLIFYPFIRNNNEVH